MGIVHVARTTPILSDSVSTYCIMHRAIMTESLGPRLLHIRIPGKILYLHALLFVCRPVKFATLLLYCLYGQPSQLHMMSHALCQTQ